MDADHRTVWELYVASWKAASAQEKRALLERCLAPHCVYTDPQARTEGWDALLAHMADYHQQVPGGHFVTQQFIALRGKSMAKWKMLSRDSVPIGEGVSYGEYGEDGRLTGVAAFYET